MPASCGTSPEFRRYVDDLESLALGHHVPAPPDWNRRLLACLDTEPANVLRRAENSAPLRRQGAYFTASAMATTVANTLAIKADSRHTYLDPTSGAGDLLLAVAKKLPIRQTLSCTIATWGERLAGFEISPEFVRAAKARLVLLAARRCRVRPPVAGFELRTAFPRIVEADFFSNSTAARLADVVIMNPPFGYTDARDDCTWASGRVNAAASFFETVIHNSRGGTRIAAILPDVLRAGTRYKRWREKIIAYGSIRRERPLGVFDRSADVDVYLLDYRVHQVHRYSPTTSSRPRFLSGVGRRFAVHVGPVVPHRHAKTGPLVSYVHARSLRPWAECTQIAENRRFSGRLFQPPFVTVRRTSRPGNHNRAIASLVLSAEPVAVENHLLVLLPRNGTASACRQLVARLRSAKTDDWINRRLRCRHLTTAVLADMPWWRQP